jgi:hypothetical protein
MVFIVFFSIGLSRSYDLDHKFDGITRVDSILIIKDYVCYVNLNRLRMIFLVSLFYLILCFHI